MANASYFELLRDPRWQRKRLEILQRDGWACTACRATDRQLHVHHNGYLKGKKPWEYEDWNLVTLCDDCHEKATGSIAHLKESLSRLDPALVDSVRGYIDA